jgi:hypothetical protein
LAARPNQKPRRALLHLADLAIRAKILANETRWMFSSPDLLLLFGGLFLGGFLRCLLRLLRFLSHVTLYKFKVSSLNLCSRESACTASILHHIPK